MYRFTCRCEFQKSTFYFHRLHEIIAYHLELEIDTVLSGEIEVDESYFGGKRKGNQGLGVAGKVLLFGPFERRDKVYTKVIANAVSILDNDLYLTPILD